MKLKYLVVSALLSALLMISDIAYGHSFDYLFSCDNCSQPEMKAKYLVPDYTGEPDGEEDESEGEEYSVLVVDAALNQFHAYEVFVDYQEKSVDEMRLSSKELEIASKALEVAQIKSKLKLMFNRDIGKLNFSSAQSSKQFNSQSSSELDCQDPGIVAKSRVCQDVYTREIAEEFGKVYGKNLCATHF